MSKIITMGPNLYDKWYNAIIGRSDTYNDFSIGTFGIRFICLLPDDTYIAKFEIINEKKYLEFLLRYS